MNMSRWAGYVGELQEFSASHGVPFGSVEDLPGVLKTLGEGGTFAEECTCMVRSILYREQGEVDPATLARLLAQVWGDVGEPEEAILFALRRFVSTAMRGPVLEEAECVKPKLSGEPSCGESEVDVNAQMVTFPMEAEARGVPAMDLERTIRELEVRSPEVRMYRELVSQRDAALAAERITSERARDGETERLCAFAQGFDPWDESSELQTELRRFARHRERVLAREAERASRPLHERLLGGAESVLGQLLGGSRGAGRGSSLRSH